MVEKIKDGSLVEKLFEGNMDTSAWSCLQGVMGELYGIRAEGSAQFVSAMAVQCDFIFFAGEPSRELAAYEVDANGDEFCIMVPPDDAWNSLIEECYQGRNKKVTRYAIKKEKDVFDREKLRRVVDALPNEYEIQLIDERGFQLCEKQKWSCDLVGSFHNCKEYLRLGLGVIITKDGELVAGASSYSSYKEGIEIEIDTREDYRRRGLAYVCGARLILECLERGLYPSWDAQNPWSVALAEKLGYHFDKEYTAYEIYEYGAHGSATEENQN